MSPADTQGSDEELHHDTQVSLACLAQSYTPPGDIDITVKVIRQVGPTSLNFSIMSYQHF